MNLGCAPYRPPPLGQHYDSTESTLFPNLGSRVSRADEALIDEVLKDISMSRSAADGSSGIATPRSDSSGTSTPAELYLPGNNDNHSKSLPSPNRLAAGYVSFRLVKVSRFLVVVLILMTIFSFILFSLYFTARTPTKNLSLSQVSQLSILPKDFVCYTKQTQTPSGSHGLAKDAKPLHLYEG